MNMRKEMNRIFVLVVLVMFVFSLGVGFVGAQDEVDNFGPISDLNLKNIQESEFYQTIKPWVVPSGMEGISAIIIGVIALVILFAIIVDIVMLVAPFSNIVKWMIAIGLGIIMILFKWNVTFAGWVIGIGAVLFGFAGTAAMVLTIILGILAIFFIFFGGLWIQKWITGVQGRRQILEATRAAYKEGAKIKKGKEVLKLSGE